MLGADGEADSVGANAAGQELFAGELGVGLVEAGVNDRDLTSATLASRENSCRLSVNLRAAAAALISKVKMDAAPLGSTFFIKARVARAGSVHPLDLGWGLRVDDLQGVFHMALDPQRQRLNFPAGGGRR